MIVERTFERTHHRVAPVWHPQKGFEVFPGAIMSSAQKYLHAEVAQLAVRRLAEPNTRVRFPYPAHQMQRTRLRRMSLNLLVGGEIRYTTRGEGNRTVGREWLHKIWER